MGDEKDRVAWLLAELESVVPSAWVIEGAGDDCAVLGPFGDKDLVVGSDYVRGTKFLLYEEGLLSLRDVGRFLVTANASDLAAMGADPVSFLSVVRYSSTMSDSDFQEVMLGIDEACLSYGLNLSGGDTGSAERLIVSGTAVGTCPHGTALLRSRAQPGDVLSVTGRLGSAGAAVAARSQGQWNRLSSQAETELIDAWQRCSAQLPAGLAIRSTGVRVAAQDVSDGLRATAREVADASGVAAVLDLANVPIGAGVAEVAELLELDPVALAISGSTDFCLMFACSPEDFEAVRLALAAQGVGAWPVGRCELGEGVWIDVAGERIPAPGVEWRHGSRDVGGLVADLKS